MSRQTGSGSPGAPADPVVSGLQAFITANQLPKGSPHKPDIHRLALHITHNLRFQHEWTDIRLHYHLRIGPEEHSLPRPVISGLPPKRLYVHPDEQIDFLQKQRNAGKAGWPELSKEREWVLPSQLREAWTLRRFGEVFDSLSTVPPTMTSGPPFADAEQLRWAAQPDGSTPSGSIASVSQSPISDRSASASASSRKSSVPVRNSAESQQESNPWRLKNPKRMLLATLDDDSTVVYYIVHDGIVKPRQN
jgi:tRNA-splicing endonuclease subunit Sen15, fungi type